jgi:ParB-like nuclease family protein
VSEQYKDIPIDDVDLDVENPRVRRFLEYTPNPSAEQIHLALGFGSSESDSGGSTTFRTLRESIRESGRIFSPIIVRPGVHNKYLVIEGNTRLAIYKEFRDEEGAGKGWDTIPAIIRDDLKDIDVHTIRLQAHLVGPRPWDPYSKAKYLTLLRDQEHLTMPAIESMCGGRRRELAELIDAYHDMEKYYRPALSDESAFDITRFSAFVELQKPGVKEAILAAGFTPEDFARWVIDFRINPLSTVRALPKILANKEAKQKFLKSGAKEALKHLDPPSGSGAVDNISLETLARAVTERLDGIGWNDVKALKADPSGSKALALVTLLESLQSLCAEISKDG